MMRLTLRQFSFLLTIALAVGFGAPRASATSSLDALVQVTMAELSRLGIAKENIIVKPSSLGNQRFMLVRSRQGDRIYDISLFHDQRLYLATSYNRGQKFREPVRFRSLAALVSTLRKIEAKAKSARKKGGSSALSDDTMVDASGQQGGGRKKKNSRSQSSRSRLAARLNAAANSAATAQGGGAGGGSDEGQANAGQLGQASRSAAQSFSGDPCAQAAGGASVTGTGSSQNSALTDTIAALGEALGTMAIAQHDMGALSLASTGGLRSGSGLVQAERSGQLQVGSKDDDLVAMLAAGRFGASNDSEKERLLRRILRTALDDTSLDEPGVFRNVRQLHQRFMKWSAQLDRPKKKILTDLKGFIATMIIRQAEYSKRIAAYPAEQRPPFVIVHKQNRSRIILDGEADNPESAAVAFYHAAGIVLDTQLMQERELIQLKVSNGSLSTRSSLNKGAFGLLDEMMGRIEEAAYVK